MPEVDDYAVDDYATALADGIDAALPTWVVRCVATVMTAWSGEVPVDVALAAEAAAQAARTEVGTALRELLGRDIDEQRTTPLTMLRAAVRYPTAVLEAAGVPAVERDRFAEAAFPADIYDLSPATFSDIDPGLADAGLAWGAAKAFVHKRRHSASDQDKETRLDEQT